jgi:hypothetical protein
MTFVIVALALVIGFIVGGAWPKLEKKEPEKPKPIGYDSKGQLIYEKPRNKIDVLA